MNRHEKRSAVRRVRLYDRWARSCAMSAFLIWCGQTTLPLEAPANPFDAPMPSDEEWGAGYDLLATQVDETVTAQLMEANFRLTEAERIFVFEAARLEAATLYRLRVEAFSASCLEQKAAWDAVFQIAS